MKKRLKMRKYESGGGVDATNPNPNTAMLNRFIRGPSNDDTVSPSLSEPSNNLPIDPRMAMLKRFIRGSSNDDTESQQLPPLGGDTSEMTPFQRFINRKMPDRVEGLKSYKKGGSIRGGGCEQRGKTKGRMI